jgi:hypothetical protein
MTWCYRSLSVLCVLSLLCEVWGLYYFHALLSHTPEGFWFPLRKIWLPEVPLLLTWLITAITAWCKKVFGTFLLLFFSFFVGNNCIVNLFTITKTFDGLYWASLLASIFALLAIMVNLIVFVVFIYNRFAKS